MHPRLARLAAVALPAALLSFACAQLPPSPDALATAVAGTLTAVAEAATAAATPTPPAPPPSATAPAAPTPLAEACPPPGDPPPIPPGDFASYASGVLAYLNAGGGVPGLAQALQDVGALDPAGGLGIVQLSDLTGDGLGDVIVVMVDTQAQFAGPVPPGQVLIFLCAAGAHELAYASTLSDEFTGPAIVAVQDVTEDGRHDLLYSTTFCGASTCFNTLAVIAWDGAAFADAISGDTTLSFAEINLTPGAGDGAVEIEMYGGAQGSVGAGPPRQYANVWAWNGSDIVLNETRLDPPEYRFHLLNDADDAALAGAHAEAVAMYERVSGDETLLGWEAVADERAHLSAYARYRIMLARLLSGDAPGAQAARADLQAAFPAGAPGGEWAQAAGVFDAAYQPGASVPAGCAAVVAYANATPALLEPFANYGYANRVMEAEDVCPF